MIQYSPLFHQHTAGIKPVLGRTLILKHKPIAKIGSLHLPEQYQGTTQEDWRAEVVANAEQGGWRNGDLHERAFVKWAHLLDMYPGDMDPKIRKDRSIWKIKPYFVHKPEVPVGTKIICCWLSGQPIISLNDQEYYLTDGEHAYKGIILN